MRSNSPITADGASEVLHRLYGINRGGVAVSSITPTTYGVEGDGQARIMKLCPQDQVGAPAMVDQAYRLLSEASLTPQVIPTTDGEALGRWDGFWTLLQIRLPNARPADRGDAEAMAGRLAALHRALSGLDADEARNHIEREVEPILERLPACGLNDHAPLVERFQKLSERYPTQLIHNDLHPSNVVVSGGVAWFIDAMSASSGVTALDVSICAHRLHRAGGEKTAAFVDAYNGADPPCPVVAGDVGICVAFHAIQRLVFILTCAKNGDRRWLGDLDNQKRYLEEGVALDTTRRELMQ